MLLRNKTGVAKQKGNYRINPSCWGVIPDRLVGTWKNNRDFETLEPTDGENIFIYAGCPIEVTGGGQHPTQIARSLSRQGHRVVYIQNYYQYDPEFVILGERNWMESRPANPIELEKHRIIFESLEPGIVLFTFPSQFCNSIVDIAHQAGHKVVYWCLDDWTAINAVNGNRMYRSSHEEEMVNRADILIATADILRSHIISLLYNPDKDVHVIPNGYSTRNFPPQGARLDPPMDLRLGEPTLVYWGELGGSWIDWEMIERTAIRFPEAKINLIGPMHRLTDKPVKLPNVHYLGEKDVDDLQAYGLNSDIGLVPFQNDAVSAAVNPIKAYEYIACGLWVMGPESMKELAKFPNTFQYKNHNEALAWLEAYKAGNFVKDFTDPFLEESTWYGRAAKFIEVSKTCHSLSMMPSPS